MVLEYDKDQVDLVVVSLAINLVINKRNAEIMVEGGKLQLIMDQAFRNLDSLLMKVVRNISQHDSCKLLFVVCKLFMNYAVSVLRDFKLILKFKCFPYGFSRNLLET